MEKKNFESENMMNMESAITNELIVVNRKEYCELLLDKLKEKLYFDTLSFVENSINIKDTNELLMYYNQCLLKVNGCEGILHQKYLNVLELKLIKLKMFINENSKPKRIIKTYLLFDKISRLYKIGRSIEPGNRISRIQSPGKLELITVINQNVEKSLHRKFKDKRIHGEWFKLSDSDVKYIISLI